MLYSCWLYKSAYEVEKLRQISICLGKMLLHVCRQCASELYGSHNMMQFSSIYQNLVEFEEILHFISLLLCCWIYSSIYCTTASLPCIINNEIFSSKQAPSPIFQVKMEASLIISSCWVIEFWILSL